MPRPGIPPQTAISNPGRTCALTSWMMLGVLRSCLRSVISSMKPRIASGSLLLRRTLGGEKGERGTRKVGCFLAVQVHPC